jgi:hypothetical protein
MLAAPLAAAALLTTPCDTRALRDYADIAKYNIISAIDGAETIEAWKQVFDNGGAIGWTATEYSVDARSTFVFAFDRSALRVYRANAFANTNDATEGCVDASVKPEAVIPWTNVREIEAGNWVLWFRLKQPVEIRSDRSKKKTVKELKAFFHGAPSGKLTYHYNVVPVGRHWFWGTTIYRVDNLRGIAVGPTDFQRRLQYVLASAIDPEGRIAMKRKGRGAGW